MLDVVSIDVAQTELAGLARRGLGKVGLAERGTGTVTYSALEPCGFVLWQSAELKGVADPSDPSVRVRFSDGASMFWLDPDGMIVRPVTVDDWESEYSLPSVLGAIGRWTKSYLQVVVHLVSSDAIMPTVGRLEVAMELPAWEGAVAQSVQKIAEAVQNIEPIMVETVVPKDDAGEGEWAIGKPYTEHGFVTTSLVQVTVDGDHKSAVLESGKVRLLGPKAPKGSTVRIALKYRPNTAVRRVGEIRFINELPAWVISNLVSTGGLNGRLSAIDVNGFQVERRRVDLSITVRGAADRQTDALAMRAALQSAFSPGVPVVIDSGRKFHAHIDGLVEVLPQGGSAVPQAVGVIRMALEEAVSGRWVRTPTKSVDDGMGGTKLVQRANVITLGLSDAGITIEMTESEEGCTQFTIS